MISMIKPLGRDVEVGEHGDDLVGEPGPAQRPRRHVDRHRHVAEVTDVGQRPAHHPGREPVDEVGLLAHGDEAVGVEQAQGGVLPAHQGLDRLHVPVLEGGLGLVVHDELVGVDGPAQLGDEPEVRGVVVVVVGVVAHHAGVLGLGHVHGHIGVLQEVVDVDAVVGSDDVADARLHRQGEAAHLDLVLDDVAQAPEHLLGVTDLGQDDAELVAAQAGHGVLGPGVVGEALGQLGQQLVAAVVAQRVVDLFEPVEVDDGDGGPRVASRRPAGRLPGRAGGTATGWAAR